MYQIRLQRDFLKLVEMTKVTRGFCWHHNFVPWGCLPLTCGYLHLLNHEKMCIKSEVEEILLNLQQMTILMRPSCWHQNFGPNGLSAPAQGLCLNFFSSITYPRHSGERYRTNGHLVLPCNGILITSLGEERANPFAGRLLSLHILSFYALALHFLLLWSLIVIHPGYFPKNISCPIWLKCPQSFLLHKRLDNRSRSRIPACIFATLWPCDLTFKFLILKTGTCCCYSRLV